MKKKLLSTIFWLFVLTTFTSILIALINPSFTIPVTADQVNEQIRKSLPVKRESTFIEFTIEEGAKFNFQDNGRIGMAAPFAIRPSIFRETHYQGILIASAKIRFSEKSFFLDELSDIEIQGSVVKSKRAAVVDEILGRGKDSLGISQAELDAIFELDKIGKALKDIISSQFSSTPLYTLEGKWWHSVAGIMITGISVTQDSIIVTIRPREISLAYLSILGMIISIAILIMAVRITRLPVITTLYSLLFFWT